MDADLCAGCETCADHRPQEAIELLREPGQGELLEIQKLMDHAAR